MQAALRRVCREMADATGGPFQERGLPWEQPQHHLHLSRDASGVMQRSRLSSRSSDQQEGRADGAGDQEHGGLEAAAAADVPGERHGAEALEERAVET